MAMASPRREGESTDLEVGVHCTFYKLPKLKEKNRLTFKRWAENRINVPWEIPESVQNLIAFPYHSVLLFRSYSSGAWCSHFIIWDPSPIIKCPRGTGELCHKETCFEFWEVKLPEKPRSWKGMSMWPQNRMFPGKRTTLWYWIDFKKCVLVYLIHLK